MDKQEFKDKIYRLFKKIKNEFIVMSDGRGSFNIMLYIWGILPGIILTLFFQRKIDRIEINSIQLILYILLGSYFLWHIFVIRKTLKVQPENRVVKPSKKEKYRDKSKEEIESIKKEERKERLEKFLLLRAWDSTPNYILVGCFDMFIVLSQLQGLLKIIN